MVCNVLARRRLWSHWVLEVRYNTKPSGITHGYPWTTLLIVRGDWW